MTRCPRNSTAIWVGGILSCDVNVDADTVTRDRRRANIDSCDAACTNTAVPISAPCRFSSGGHVICVEALDNGGCGPV